MWMRLNADHSSRHNAEEVSARQLALCCCQILPFLVVVDHRAHAGMAGETPGSSWTTLSSRSNNAESLRPESNSHIATFASRAALLVLLPGKAAGTLDKSRSLLRQCQGAGIILGLKDLLISLSDLEISKASGVDGPPAEPFRLYFTSTFTRIQGWMQHWNRCSPFESSVMLT